MAANPPPAPAPSPAAEPKISHSTPVPKTNPNAREADVPRKFPPAPKPEPEPQPDAEITIPTDSKVLYREVGWASWYGPGFQKRKGANGEVFDTERMTAAHRTLPLNSIVRVTNVKTGESALVRITDRGPFVNDRVLDLSRAAARKLSVFQAGTALVRIEVLAAPAPITSGGRWCVQIGAFSHAQDATVLQDKLSRRYHTAKILQFASPNGDSWLRVRVADDDKRRAQELMRDTHTDAGMYLVRLD